MWVKSDKTQKTFFSLSDRCGPAQIQVVHRLRFGDVVVSIGVSVGQLRFGRLVSVSCLVSVGLSFG